MPRSSEGAGGRQRSEEPPRSKWNSSLCPMSPGSHRDLGLCGRKDTIRRGRVVAGRGFRPDTCTRVASRMSHRSCRGREPWALGSEGRLGGAGQPLTALSHLEADSGLWSTGRGAEVGWRLPQETPMWLGRQEELVWNSLEGACEMFWDACVPKGIHVVIASAHSYRSGGTWVQGGAAGLRQPLPSRGSSWEQPRW